MAITDKVATERRNLGPAALYEHAVRRAEAAIVSNGAPTALTGKHAGRTPKDKFIVKEPTTQDATGRTARRSSLSISDGGSCSSVARVTPARSRSRSSPR